MSGGGGDCSGGSGGRGGLGLVTGGSSGSGGRELGRLLQFCTVSDTSLVR